MTCGVIASVCVNEKDFVKTNMLPPPTTNTHTRNSRNHVDIQASAARDSMVPQGGTMRNQASFLLVAQGGLWRGVCNIHYWYPTYGPSDLAFAVPETW